MKNHLQQVATTHNKTTGFKYLIMSFVKINYRNVLGSMCCGTSCHLEVSDENGTDMNQ
jgi:hypothetical protein